MQDYCEPLLLGNVETTDHDWKKEKREKSWDSENGEFEHRSEAPAVAVV